MTAQGINYSFSVWFLIYWQAMKQAKLQQSAGLPDTARFDDLEHWIIVVKQPEAKEQWPSFPYSDVLQKRHQRLRKDGDDDPPPLLTDLPNDKAGRVALSTIKPGLSAFELLCLARRLAEGHQDYQARELGIAVIGFSAKKSARVAEALLAAVLAADAEMPDFRKKRKDRPRLEQVHLYGVPEKYGFARSFAEDKGNALARYLTALPQNELTPTLYRKRIAQLARESGWKSQFFSIAQLEKREGRRRSWPWPRAARRRTAASCACATRPKNRKPKIRWRWWARASVSTPAA